MELDPAHHGIARASLADLVGGDPATNAGLARAVLSGARGPHRDIVVLNAAAALVVGDAAPDLDAGMALAGRVIDSGAAAATLERLVEVSTAARAGGEN